MLLHSLKYVHEEEKKTASVYSLGHMHQQNIVQQLWCIKCKNAKI